jgi:hypothetical protein
MPTDSFSMINRKSSIINPNVYVSTLRRFVAALGGELRIVAHFPPGDVVIDQFEDIEKQEPADGLKWRGKRGSIPSALHAPRNRQRRSLTHVGWGSAHADCPSRPWGKKAIDQSVPSFPRLDLTGESFRFHARKEHPRTSRVQIWASQML